MKAFFEGVGAGDTSGIWEDTPRLRPEFREITRRRLAAKVKARANEEMGT